MALETGTYIDDLNSANPTASDDVSEGDDHIRLLKSTIQASFPNITGAMNATQAQLNQIGTGQFAFPATQNASADANTLDDYEEGTFTPTLQDNTASDAEGQTYSAQNGNYTKIGNMVFFNVHIAMSSLGTLTGTQVARIANLPFAAAAGTEWAITCSRGGNMSITAGASVGGHIRNGNDYIELYLWDDATGSSGLQINEITASGVLNISGHYQV